MSEPTSSGESVPTASSSSPSRPAAPETAGAAVNVGCVAVLIVLAVAFVRGSGYYVTTADFGPAGGSAPVAASSPSASPAPSVTTVRPTVPPATVPPRDPIGGFVGTGSPVAGRITDKKAGISYAKLGGPWGEVTSRKALYEKHGFTAGQRFVTAANAFGDSWYATQYSAPLTKFLRPVYTGPASIPEVAATSAKVLADTFYPKQRQRENFASEPITVGDRQGYVIMFELSFQPPAPNIEVSRETAVVVALDTGKPVPAILYMSIPGTHYKLRPDIETVIESVEVLP